MDIFWLLRVISQGSLQELETAGVEKRKNRKLAQFPNVWSPQITEVSLDLLRQETIS